MVHRVRCGRTPLGGLVVAAVLAGCGEGAPGPGWDVEVDTRPGGAVLVRNLPPADIEPTWVIEPEVMVGRMDGGGADQFGQIRGVAPLPDGGLVVLDAQAQELRVFGEDGRHLRTLGRRGQGPGELSGANGILVGPDGLIRVHDPGNARLSLFHPETGFVRSERLQILGWGFLWEGVMDREGRIHEVAIGGDIQDRWRVVRIYDETGAPADEIRLEPLGSGGGEGPSGAFVHEGGMVIVPFWPRGLRVLDADGYFWRKGGGVNDYRLVRTTFQGDTVRIIETRRPPVPVSAAQRDSAVAWVRDLVGEQEMDWSRIPGEHPVVLGAFVDDAERLWVRVTTPEPLAAWDIFGPDGIYRGTAVTELNVPPNWRPEIRDDLFYTLHLGEFDVPFAVRARIRELEGL